MMGKRIERDERTVAVEDRSYRWAYLFLSYGMLASAAYRGFALHEQSWDLLAMVIVGGVVAASYQGRRNVLTRRWGWLTAVAIVAALLLAAITIMIGRAHGNVQ